MLRRLLHKIVPPENSLPLAITGLMNLIAFSGPKLLQVLGWSLPMHDMTAAFDRAFPFSPVWVFVYVAAFPFWIYQYSVVAKESRSLCYRLVAADFAAKVICLLFFVLLPTHNVRPPPATGNGRLHGLGHADDLAAGHPDEPVPLHPLLCLVARHALYL